MPTASDTLEGFRSSHPYRELQADGTRWNYIACGQGTHTLVLLHGFLADAYMWFHQIRAFEGQYRIIAPTIDVRGMNLAALCRGLASILHAEDIDQATLLGVSAGGAWSQYFLRQYPHMVRGLILSHTGVPSKRGSDRAKKAARLISYLPWSLTKALLRLRAKPYPGSDWNHFKRTYFEDVLRSRSKESIVESFLAAGDFRPEHELSPGDFERWYGETLILCTRDDAGSLRHLEQLQQLHPRAKVHMFPRGGHHTVFLFPEDYNQVVRRFLDSITQEAARRG